MIKSVNTNEVGVSFVFPSFNNGHSSSRTPLLATAAGLERMKKQIVILKNGRIRHYDKVTFGAEPKMLMWELHGLGTTPKAQDFYKLVCDRRRFVKTRKWRFGMMQ